MRNPKDVFTPSFHYYGMTGSARPLERVRTVLIYQVKIEHRWQWRSVNTGDNEFVPLSECTEFNANHDWNVAKAGHWLVEGWHKSCIMVTSTLSALSSSHPKQPGSLFTPRACSVARIIWWWSRKKPEWGEVDLQMFISLFGSVLCEFTVNHDCCWDVHALQRCVCASHAVPHGEPEILRKVHLPSRWHHHRHLSQVRWVRVCLNHLYSSTCVVELSGGRGLCLQPVQAEIRIRFNGQVY